MLDLKSLGIDSMHPTRLRVREQSNLGSLQKKKKSDLFATHEDVRTQHAL